MIHRRLATLWAFLWTTAAALILLPGCTREPVPYQPSEFCRFTPSDVPGEGKLQTAIVTYANDSGAEVALVAAVHVGDAEYYDTLEVMFAGQDAVLYELIADPEAVRKQERGRQSGVSFVQRMLKGLLELEFQLDAIDYTRDNFVHADLEPEEFERRQAERGESMLSFIFDLMLEEMKKIDKGEGSNVSPLAIFAALLTDDHAKSLKFILAQELARMADMGTPDEEGKSSMPESVIFTDRNVRAMSVVGQELRRHNRICVFYGAAHMPDLEHRLIQELGFRKKRQDWITAWKVEAKKPRDPAKAEGGR